MKLVLLLIVTLLMNCFQAQKANDGRKKVEKNIRKKDVEKENPEDFIDPVTSAGAKKQLSRHIAKQYNPNAVEKS